MADAKVEPAARGAVLDACVLIPAALRDTLLWAADAGLYQPLWSELILEEVRRNLVSRHRASEQTAERLVRTLRSQFPGAAVTGFEPYVGLATNHPTDRHVVAVAVAARADIIVTLNRRDFPPQTLEPLNIESISPDDFLIDLLEEQPDQVARVLVRQASALNKPARTLEQVLAALELHAPGFAERARQRIEGDASDWLQDPRPSP